MEKMELSEALKANASVLEGLLGINDTWYKRRFGEITDFNEANNTGYMFVDKTQSLDNNPIHQVIMDSWKRLLLMRSPSSKLL